MSEHVSEWLNAHLDGELKGRKLQRVQEHLAECDACRAELESLQGLSALLQEAPAAELASHERFVSQVNLRLPERRTTQSGGRLIEAGWWMIPVGLLVAWIFLSTTFLVSDVVTAANTFGLLDTSGTLPLSDPSEGAVWAARLGQFGLLEGESLRLAETAESFTRNVLPQFIWQVSIAFLYLAWIAIWWARQRRREPLPLLEG
jgi:hypothetical protein